MEWKDVEKAVVDTKNVDLLRHKNTYYECII